ncbi:hypothetical protein AVEN_239377-1 [Araneus ventricosus]|uniref:Uncharacterized protein n=1 Tax=Araneus ventricosus TaxID=182803 RepID=A0A4Y2EBC2_ARAVE|nr:hypothetical protein AVEN_239377-1 [Araneus ventricosus]
MVRIKPTDYKIVPYMSAINLKFRIKIKCFSNQFFVTLNPLNSYYHAILGYDFLQRNKVVIDTVNKQLLVENQTFEFAENPPTHINREDNSDVFENDNNSDESVDEQHRTILSPFKRWELFGVLRPRHPLTGRIPLCEQFVGCLRVEHDVVRFMGPGCRYYDIRISSLQVYRWLEKGDAITTAIEEIS